MAQMVTVPLRLTLCAAAAVYRPLAKVVVPYWS